MEVREDHLAKIDCNQGLIKSVRFDAGGKYALTCGDDRTIKLWQPNESLEIECYKGHSADVTDCQTNEDNSQFASCSGDRSVIVWDIESCKIMRRFRNMAAFNSICYGPSENTVLASSADGTVRIYDLRALNAWEPIQSLTDAREAVTCCRVHENLVFTASLDKCLRTYDIRQGQLTVDTLPTALNHITVSPDAKYVLVSLLRDNPILVGRNSGRGGKDQTADPARDQPMVLHQFAGNTNKLFRLESCLASWRQDGQTVVAGSEDGHVYLWDLPATTMANSASGDFLLEPKLALKHNHDHPSNSQPPIIQTISSDRRSNLLSACGGSVFVWSL